MKAIIIGGGKIGYHLLKTLSGSRYEVTLVERKRDVCEKIAGEVEADIICGDGTDLEILKEAGIEEANVIAAVTGTDEENLVICQIAKINFDIARTITRVNNPKNIEMFKKLGVDKIVCSTQVIANLIEYEFDKENFKVIQALERGSMLLVEILIEKQTPWRNCLIRDMDLPHESVIVSVLRGDNVIFPKGDTQVLFGDKILMITNRNTISDLNRRLRIKGEGQNEW